MLVWLVGLSGADKTTISEKCADTTKLTVPCLVLIDGDFIRGLFSGRFGLHF